MLADLAPHGRPTCRGLGSQPTVLEMGVLTMLGCLLVNVLIHSIGVTGIIGTGIGFVATAIYYFLAGLVIAASSLQRDTFSI